ncbi:hypothetical protein BJ875DRAFT_498296 [Amylocarpus encephaloides]|uniref:Uncharacterized protein n=1 Tax=Amylocarpus encephaloides TaxID=45428 RepID=A0A9P8C2F9_9HELO|nr:hypothetical protein BJ875DRAFT_498296 [Amylocarpus encephaloides]
MSLGVGAAPIDLRNTASSLVDRSSTQGSRLNQGSQGNQQARPVNQNQKSAQSQPRDQTQQHKSKQGQQNQQNQSQENQNQNQENQNNRNPQSQENRPNEQRPSQQNQQNQNNEQNQQNQSNKPNHSQNDDANIIVTPTTSTNHGSQNNQNSQSINIITDTLYDKARSLVGTDLIEGTTYAFILQHPYDDSESNSLLKTLAKALGFQTELLLVAQLTTRTDHGNTYLGFDGTVFQLQIQDQNSLSVQSVQAVWTDSLEGFQYAFLKTTTTTIAELASQGTSWVSNHPTFQYDVQGTNFGTYIQNLITLL